MKFQIEDEIKSGVNKSIYLLYGDENYLMNKFKNELISVLIPNKEDMDTELTMFEGEKTTALSIIDTAQMISFTGGRRIILVSNSNLFYRGKQLDTDMLTEFVNEDEEGFVIIFVEKNVDKRSKLYKAVSKVGFCEEYASLKTDDIANFIVEQVSKNGSKISGSDAKYFALNLYNDLENVVTEVEKVCSYKINGTVTKEDIDLLASKDLEVRVFELVDKIGQKDAKGAIEIFNNMLLVKESPLMVLTMVGRTFKTLLLCKTLLESGTSQDEIAKKTKLHPFVVKKNLATTRNFKKIELYNALFEVLEADEKIKTGLIKDTVVVENIIIKYAKKEK